MSVQSQPYYWLECDQSGCEAKSTEGGEHSAWMDEWMAEEEAFNSDWTITSDGKHYCDQHHPEEEDDGET